MPSFPIGLFAAALYRLFVRFSDMRIVSHRSWTLGYTWGRASLRLICCGMRDALVDRKHELKRLLLRFRHRLH